MAIREELTTLLRLKNSTNLTIVVLSTKLRNSPKADYMPKKAESSQVEVSKVMLEQARNIRCELVSGDDVSYLEGKLKTLLDGMGLPEKQEKAQKDMVRIILWDWFNFITNHHTDHLSEKRHWYYDQFGLNPIKEEAPKKKTN